MCSWACCSSSQVKVYFDHKVIPKKRNLIKWRERYMAIDPNAQCNAMLGLLSSLVISMVNTAQLRLRAGSYLVVHAHNTFHRFYCFYWEGISRSTSCWLLQNNFSLYISETVSAQYRGKLGTLPALLHAAGVLGCYIIGKESHQN